MLLVERQISFISKTQTGYWIAKQTGIPSSTVYRYLKGIANIPFKYMKDVRAPYQSTAYSSLRLAGSSAIQAHRFAWYNPETVSKVVEDLGAKIKWLARGYAVKRIEALGLAKTETNIKRFLSAGSRKIRQGIHDSKEPYEVWQDYGMKKEK